MESRRVSSLLVTLVLSAGASAGELNPPAGPVAPTGRFGPRIEVNDANTPGSATSLFVISQPGSYYLAANLTGQVGKHGIEITSSGVTLDLGGFELTGVAGSLDGISVTTTISSIRIYGGTIRQWGASGVNARSAGSSSMHDLLAGSNTFSGLLIGSFGRVDRCVATFNGSVGIEATGSVHIGGCVAASNAHHGITVNNGSTVIDNTLFGNQMDGIGALGRCMILRNNSYSNRGNGIRATDGATISGNTTTSNMGDGILAANGCLVSENNCHLNGRGSGNGAGVHVTGRNNRIDGNNVTDNDRGIDVDVNGNIIIRNTASDNSINYAISAAQAMGPTITATSTITSNNPWANFSF